MRRIVTRLAAIPVAAAALAAFLLAGDRSAPDYFPFETGRQWHYRVVRTTMDGEAAQAHVVRNVAGTAADGSAVVARVSSDGSRHYYARAADGVRWIASRRRDGDAVNPAAPALVLPEAPRAGMQWTAPGRTLVLEKTGPPQETLYRLDIAVPMTYTIASTDDTVTVPAGQYEACVRVEGRGAGNANVRNYLGNTRVEIETVDWYAPGVGLVRSERRERTDKTALDAGHLRMELAAVAQR